MSRSSSAYFAATTRCSRSSCGDTTSACIVRRAVSLRDPGLAEDAIQQGYVNAYFHLNQFAGRSRFSTWLTRIVLHDASARARREATQTPAIASVPDTLVDRQRSPLPDPERQALTGELNALVEA